jgi:hypothetical protein
MSSKKTTTDQHETSNQTTTPSVPDWLLNPAQNVAGQLGGLLGGNAGQYTPGMSDLQKQANTAASNLTPSTSYGDATTAVGNVGDVQGQSVLDNLGSYETPYRDSVLNPVLNDFDQQAGQTRAAQAAAAARGGAFGGSRYGVAQAQTEDNLARGRAATEGSLLNNLYTQATGLSEADAARRQQAMQGNQQVGLQKAGLLTNIGSAQGADQRANLALQGQFGEDATNLENQAKQYPLQYQAQLEGLLGGLNTGQYSGQSQTGVQDTHGTQTVSDPTGQLLSGLGSAAQLASLFTPAGPLSALSLAAKGAAGGSSGFGAIVSDRRLKRDVMRIGQRADGLPLYAFRYLWDRAVRFGVMAQDVLKVKPEAVILHPTGFMLVNAEALA